MPPGSYCVPSFRRAEWPPYLATCSCCLATWWAFSLVMLCTVLPHHSPLVLACQVRVFSVPSAPAAPLSHDHPLFAAPFLIFPIFSLVRGIFLMNYPCAADLLCIQSNSSMAPSTELGGILISLYVCAIVYMVRGC